MNGLMNVSLNRRRVLGWSIASGSLLLGFHFPRKVRGFDSSGSRAIALNAYIQLAPDGTVTMFSPFTEMGQGTYTSVPMLLAEELDVDLDRVRVEQAPLGDEYKILEGNERYTGTDKSTREGFIPLRQAGAGARAMLLEAAAKRWGVKAAELVTERGVVVHPGSRRRLSYGELVAAAAELDPPETVELKKPDNFRLLGKPVPRLDTAAKCAGSAQYGIDFRKKGMLTAAVRQSPVFGGKVLRVDSSAALKLPGVVAVEEIPNGVAVLAEGYWEASKGLDALQVEFSAGPAPGFSSDAYRKTLESRLDDPGIPAENVGDAAAGLRASAKSIQADYVTPLLAHATMEPMNCAAQVDNDSCTVWAPNQGVDWVAATAAEITGLPFSAIEVNTPYLGGGFGRRSYTDYVAQAVTLAMRHKGRPVKVIWSREEDMQQDLYRPMTAARYRAGFDAKGRPVALHITTVGDGPFRSDGFLPAEYRLEGGVDGSVVHGAIHQPYAIPNRRCDYVYVPSTAPVGYWRSVGHSHNAFFKESFMDEMAHAAGLDPVEFRRELLINEPRFRTVLDTVVAMAGWRPEKRLAADGSERAMGVALHEMLGSIAGQIAEVSIDGSGTVHVHKVWCAVDCGFVINPLILVQQIESGIVYGLSAALHESITVRDGRTVNSNFHDYPVLRAQEMPDVEVEIVSSDAGPSGCGELSTPPIAAAVCNALFALTGRRVRELPLNRQTSV